MTGSSLIHNDMNILHFKNFTCQCSLVDKLCNGNMICKSAFLVNLANIYIHTYQHNCNKVILADMVLPLSTESLLFEPLLELINA